jgi:hypothetical protein
MADTSRPPAGIAVGMVAAFAKKGSQWVFSYVPEGARAAPLPPALLCLPRGAGVATSSRRPLVFTIGPSVYASCPVSLGGDWLAAAAGPAMPSTTGSSAAAEWSGYGDDDEDGKEGGGGGDDELPHPLPPPKGPADGGADTLVAFSVVLIASRDTRRGTGGAPMAGEAGADAAGPASTSTSSSSSSSSTTTSSSAFLRDASARIGEALLLQEHLGGLVSRDISYLLRSPGGGGGGGGSAGGVGGGSSGGLPATTTAAGPIPATSADAPAPASAAVPTSSPSAPTQRGSCELTRILVAIADSLSYPTGQGQAGAGGRFVPPRVGAPDALRRLAHIAMPHGLPFSLSTDGGPTPGEIGVPIRPYHALLLLAEPEIILRLLPADATPLLIAAAVKAGPTRSLHELQAETGLPSSALLRLAGHFVSHGLASIVDTISEESRYALTSADGAGRGDGAGAAGSWGRGWAVMPSAKDEEEFAALGGDGAAAWGPTTQPISLSSFLALLGQTAAEGLPLRVLMAGLASPSARVAFVARLTWLLKRGLVRQLHTYVHLVWPWVLREDGGGAVDGEGDDGGDGNEGKTADDDAVGGDWTADEVEFAAHLCTEEKPPELRALFVRVLVYLRDVHVLLRRGDRAKEGREGLGEPPGSTGLGGRRGGLRGHPHQHPAFLLACRLEELMYRLRVPRQQLLDVCAAFAPWLTVQEG